VHQHQRPFLIPTPRDVAEARMYGNRRTRRALARVRGREPRLATWVWVNDDLVDLADLLDLDFSEECSE